MGRRNIVTVNVTTDVDIDLCDIDEDDLETELLSRKRLIPVFTPLSMSEQSNLIEAYFRQVQREVTQGRVPSEYEVLFWRHLHDRFL